MFTFLALRSHPEASVTFRNMPAPKLENHSLSVAHNRAVSPFATHGLGDKVNCKLGVCDDRYENMSQNLMNCELR